MKIYLAGPISGLTFDASEVWRNDFKSLIDPRISCYSPLRGKYYLKDRGPLEGAYDENPLSTSKGLTRRDRNDCMNADLVVFYLAGATRISIGTMIEFGWADAARVPTVVIMEPGNVHEHPMVQELTSFRVSTVEDAVKIAEIVLLTGERK